MEAMRPSVNVRLWARPGFFSAKLFDDDFDTFRASVAAAVSTNTAAIKLYYFRGAVVIAERIAIEDTVSLRAFAASRRREVWVYELTSVGPPSPDELPPDALLDEPPPAPQARSGRSSHQQSCFRTAVQKRDGAACVLCDLADDVGGKSRLEAAHVVAVSTPARILDEIPLFNIFDTQNGIMLCHDCHYWYDRHMWYVGSDDKVHVADALLLRAECERWAALRGRPLRLPLSLPQCAHWPPRHYWAAQQRLCLAASAARAEHVAGRPFFCDLCGARAETKLGLRRHKCGTDRHMYTPLHARAFPAAAAAAAASSGGGEGGRRELVFHTEDSEVVDADADEASGGWEAAGKVA